MKLSKTLRTGALTVGLVAVLGGCTATQNGRGGNETLLGLSLMSLGIQKNNPAAAAVGRGLLNYGAAKAGASQTNVNVNVYYGGSRSNLKEGQVYICTAKDKWVRAKAVNGDLRATWDNSLINFSYDCKINR